MMSRLLLTAAAAAISAGLLLTSAWAQKPKQTESTTIRWADGGHTTVYGPPRHRSKDGGIFLFR